MVSSLQDEVAKLKGELEACKVQVAQAAMVQVGEPSYVWDEVLKLKAELEAFRSQGTTVPS
jgi:hypothetical protein